MKNIRFEKYHEQVKDILKLTDFKHQHDGDLNTRIENYCKALCHNQFITVLDAYRYEFTFSYGVKQALGHDSKDFTAKNLVGYNLPNSHTTSVIHPDDVSWYLHYGTLLYKILGALTSSIDFSSDHAWFKFRVRNKSDKWVVAEYITFLHETTSDGKLLSHLDIWTILPLTNPETFTPDFGFYTRENYDQNVNVFHQINEEQLGIKFSTREIEVAKALSMGYTRKEVAERLKIGPGSVNTHVNNMKEKTNTYQQQFGPNRKISNLTELLRFASAYKLLR